MRSFVQVTPESCNPPKLPIDAITSANHGGCGASLRRIAPQPRRLGKRHVQDFPIHNLPFGISLPDARPVPGVAIGI